MCPLEYINCSDKLSYSIRSNSKSFNINVPAPNFSSAYAGGEVKAALDQKRFMALNPMMRGSSVKTLVLSRESSLLVKKSVTGASLNRFLT